MKKGIKVALNILSAIGIGSGGYVIGYKVAHKKYVKWAAEEINNVIACCEKKEAEREDIISEKLVKPEDLSPEILEQMEHGKADEVVIETTEVKEPPVVVEEKPRKKSSKKKPYFISNEEFDADSSYENTVELEVDSNGDIYEDQSEEIFQDWTKLGSAMINKMVTDHKVDGVNEWFIRDDKEDVFYSVTFRK